MQLLRHRATESAAAEAEARLEVTSIGTELDTAIAKITDLTANLAHATERESKVVREALKLCTDTAKVQEQLVTEKNTHRATKAKLARTMKEQEQMATKF